MWVWGGGRGEIDGHEGGHGVGISRWVLRAPNCKTLKIRFKGLGIPVGGSTPIWSSAPRQMKRKNDWMRHCPPVGDAAQRATAMAGAVRRSDPAHAAAEVRHVAHCLHLKRKGASNQMIQAFGSVMSML